MHLSYVGAGADEQGNLSSSHQYFPGVNYTKYGIADTITSGKYDSYYPGDIVNGYPKVATLMGYHQFVG